MLNRLRFAIDRVVRSHDSNRTAVIVSNRFKGKYFGGFTIPDGVELCLDSRFELATNARERASRGDVVKNAGSSGPITFSENADNVRLVAFHTASAFVFLYLGDYRLSFANAAYGMMAIAFFVDLSPGKYENDRIVGNGRRNGINVEIILRTGAAKDGG